MQTFDIAVIGMGPGGEHVAGTLAEAGLSVLGVERGLVGGECPYWGCVPTKMMIRAANALQEARRVPELAGRVGRVEPDWSIVAGRIREEATDSWDDRTAADRFTGKGGTLVRGTGRILAPGRLEVDGTEYAVRRGIVVNTGTSASVPPIPGLSEVPFWTNHELVEAESLPRSVVVLGGGAIACELGQVLARFGVAVTMIESAAHLLSQEEPDVGTILRGVLESEGVRIHAGVEAERVRAEEEGVAVTLSDATVVRAERVLVATGREADLAGVGLDAVGVDTSATSVPVDDRCRVADGVWAIGDITGKGAFTHVSMYQAGIVVRDVLDQPGPAADYDALPRVTFSDPEIASVGLTEAQARERLASVAVGCTPLPETTRGWVHKVGNEGLIKVVADSGRGVLVGATVMCPGAGEVLGALAVAVHAEVPLDRMRSMIYAYPTFHRGIEDALGRLA
jgi:pyruvate/2-oxoglutarate dehydrogenase complex dihydrolipoamide dehydrogenase (E3) component